jgi:hypothetical protein
VRAILVEPFGKPVKFLAKRFPMKWHENDARAFVLQAQDESLDYRDTAVLANGAEAGRDSFTVTPGLERITPELLALVTDEVFRCGACLMNGAFEEVRNRYGCGIVPEGCNAHYASRVVVDDHRQPPAERPALG